MPPTTRLGGFFAGQLAVITGGASGIGRAMAAALRADGARVVLLDADAQRLAEAARALDCRGEPLDVRSREDVEAAIAAVERRDGPIDLCITSAGVVQTGEVHEFTDADWHRVLDVNLRGVIHCVQSVYPRMVARGRGRILTVASIAGLYPTPGQVSYVASKFGVVGMSLALRAEAADLGVQVSVVCPGIVDTPMRRGLPVTGADADSLRALVPAGIPVERCALVALRGLRRGRGLILVAPEARALALLQRASPALAGWVSRRAFRWLRGRLGRPTTARKAV